MILLRQRPHAHAACGLADAARFDACAKPQAAARRGITLLEVVIALVIFLFSMVAIWQLAALGTDRALDVLLHAKASMMCQRQLARITAGIDPISGGSGTFEDAPDWQYDAEVSEAEVDGLKKVSVTVRYERVDGKRVEVSLTQLVLDPAMRGSTLDTAAAASTQPMSNMNDPNANPMGGSP